MKAGFFGDGRRRITAAISQPTFYLFTLFAVVVWTSTHAEEAPAIEAPERNERIFALGRLWSEARFNFAYPENMPGEKWDSLYLAHLREMESAEDLGSYYRVLEKFVAELGDGHSAVFPKDSRIRELLFETPAVKMDLIEGKPVNTAGVGRRSRACWKDRQERRWSSPSPRLTATRGSSN